MKSRKFILSLLFSTLSTAQVISISEAYSLALKNSKELKASRYQIEANREQ